MAACSHENTAGPESEFGGSASRPGDGHHDRTAAQFDVQDCTRQLRMSWAATGGGAIVRGKPMNSPVFLADSDHLAPAMNDVDINTVDGKRGRIYVLAAVSSWPIGAVTVSHCLDCYDEAPSARCLSFR